MGKARQIHLHPETDARAREAGARNAEALALLRGWLANDSGYDEQTWPEVKESLEAHRLGSRRLFSG